MNSVNQIEINKLTNNLSVIRKIAGWSSEELGGYIGVTKQTISNIENKKNKMTKTQYIAIRTIIDYKIAEGTDDDLLRKIVYILLDAEETKENIDKATAIKSIIENMPRSVITSGAIASIGAAISIMIGAAVLPAIKPTTIISSKWLKKILK